MRKLSLTVQAVQSWLKNATAAHQGADGTEVGRGRKGGKGSEEKTFWLGQKGRKRG